VDAKERLRVIQELEIIRDEMRDLARDLDDVIGRVTADHEATERADSDG